MYGKLPSAEYPRDEVEKTRGVIPYMFWPDAYDVDESESEDLDPIEKVPLLAQYANNNRPEPSLKGAGNGVCTSLAWLFQGAAHVDFRDEWMCAIHRGDEQLL